MLQKLLIAFFTMFLLSACGGSSSSSAPETQDPPPVDDTNGDDDDDTNGDDDDTNGSDDDDTNGGDDDDANGSDDDETTNGEDECTAQEAEGYSFHFESQEEVDSWFVNGDGTNIELDFDQVNSTMTITPIQWVEDEDNWKRQTRVELEAATDLRGSTITVVMDVDEAYFADEGLGMQLVVQGENDAYADLWVGLGDLQAGSNTIEWEIAADANADGITHFGIQLTNIPNDQTILEVFSVHSVEIVTQEAVVCDDEDANGEDEESNVYQADMTDGWRVDGEAVSFEYVDDGVQYSPTAADQQFVYDVAGPIDLTGATYVITYTIDQALLDSGANIQPFAQTMNDDGSPADWDCWVNNGDHTAGEPFEKTCGPLGEFNVDADVKVGIQPKGDEVSGTLTIHSLEIQFAD